MENVLFKSIRNKVQNVQKRTKSVTLLKLRVTFDDNYILTNIFTFTINLINIKIYMVFRNFKINTYFTKNIYV